jgi:hypothetical protein
VTDWVRFVKNEKRAACEHITRTKQEHQGGPAPDIGVEAVVRAFADGYPADGCTLLVDPSSVTVNATLYAKLTFNFIRKIAFALARAAIGRNKRRNMRPHGPPTRWRPCKRPHGHCHRTRPARVKRFM